MYAVSLQHPFFFFCNFDVLCRSSAVPHKVVGSGQMCCQLVMGAALQNALRGLEYLHAEPHIHGQLLGGIEVSSGAGGILKCPV
jgi:hypothetical protein